MHDLHETEDLRIICFRVGLTFIIPVPLKQLESPKQQGFLLHKQEGILIYTYLVYPF